MLKKVISVVRHPGVKYGVPATATGLCVFTLGLLDPITLSVVALGVVGNVMLHKKGF